jgi:ABC-type sugar transport system ATPase subunit
MIELQNISKTIDDFSLTDVSLNVRDKEYLAILGPSGAGKTLLLETIAGIYPPDSGQILMDRLNITESPPGKRNIGMVYQDYMLFPHLTLEDNIAFGLKAKKTPPGIIRKKVKDSADMLGISHLLHRYPNSLSGGEHQRGAIARAIVTEPSLLLLDEPLSAVDDATTERLHQEIKNIHHLTGATTIHITHRFDEAYAMADRIAIMKSGKIIQIDSPHRIFNNPVNRWVAHFTGGKNIFQGFANLQDNCCHVNVSGTVLKADSPLQGDVFLSIRPENIFISRALFNEPNLNSFTATVISITNRGRLIEAELLAGITFITILTRQSAEKLNLHPSQSVHITIKTRDVHVFKE